VRQFIDFPAKAEDTELARADSSPVQPADRLARVADSHLRLSAPQNIARTCLQEERSPSRVSGVSVGFLLTILRAGGRGEATVEDCAKHGVNRLGQQYARAHTKVTVARLNMVIDDSAPVPASGQLDADRNQESR